MKNITLGGTGITAPQNGFGALPIQRISDEAAVELLREAYRGGMRFFDTARAYTDSEKKLGLAFGPGSGEGGGSIRDDIIIASKTAASTPEEFRKDLETSLSLLKTDHIDIYQFHMVQQCWRPGDGTGMYECMQEAKAQGKIRHIGVTAHKLEVAKECVHSGLYETMQFPFSYLSSEKELELVRMCEDAGMGFIAMKSLAGGLIHNSEAAMAYVSQFDSVMPIWGIQRGKELEEWLAFFDRDAELTPELIQVIEADRRELSGDFCRGCGYCMPCTVGIEINQCARIGLMIRRAPAGPWLSEEYQKKMEMINDCIDCGLCRSRCPYELDTPSLLRRNLEDYRRVISGEISVD